jgi:glycosyltransferase involved in cell wall biosynthesis
MAKVVGFWRAPGVLLAPLAEALATGTEQRVVRQYVRDDFSAALVGARVEQRASTVGVAHDELTPGPAVTLLLTGELLDIKGVDGSGPAALLAAYARDPSCDFLASASGVFAGVLYDDARKRIVLFCDALGLGHLYYTHDSEKGLLFASEQKCFAASRSAETQVDPRAAEEFLRHGHLVGDGTWLSHVRLVAPGQCVVIDLINGSLSTRTYFDLERFTGERYTSYDEAKHCLKEAWAAAFERSLRGVSRAYVPLSGEAAPRLLLAGLARRGVDVTAWTVADYDSEDALAAQKAAAVFGVVQRTARPHVGAWLSQRARLGFLAEGIDLRRLRHAAFAVPRSDASGSDARAHVVHPAFFNLLLGTGAIRGFDDLRAHNLGLYARRAFAGVSAFEAFVPQRYPFADLAFVSAALRAEVPYLLRDRLSLELSVELAPECFLDIPIARREGRTAAQLLAGVPAAKAKAKPDASPPPDVHAYLRGDADAERFLWELLSDAHALYPAYVDAKLAHAAFWAFFRGADDKALAPLMRHVSLEIWLRQLLRREFVDGLGFDAARATQGQRLPLFSAGPLTSTPRETTEGVVPDVSVIVPAYNVEAYLGECLNSLCNQELDNIEILVVDDGSTDGTLAVIERFAATDGRIRVIKTPNSGVYHARNRALDVATGRYVSFVDSDDYAHPTMLKQLLEAAERHRAEVAFCDVYQFDAARRMKVRGNTLRFKPNTPLSLATTPEMIGDGFSTLWNRLYDRAFLVRHKLKFDERFRISADMLFLQELLAKANTVVRVPLPLYFYRFATPKSLTSYEVRNQQYLTHLEITIELVDFWVRQKLFTRLAQFILLKAMRNFLWNTHIDEQKLSDVFAKFHAYLKKLNVGPVAIAKIPAFERRAFLLLRSGDYPAFRRHVRRYRAKMVEAKGGELSKLEQVAAEIDALRTRVTSSLKLKANKEPEKRRYRLLWPAAQLGVIFARGEGFQLNPYDFCVEDEVDVQPRKPVSALMHAKYRLFLEADVAQVLTHRKANAQHRVLHFSNAFSVPSETFTYDVITGLEQHASLDNYVMCFDRQLPRERPYEKTIELRGSVRDELEAFEPRAMAKIDYVLSRVRPDIVHCHFGWVGIPLALYLAREGKELPLVITMHGTDVNMWPARHAWYSDALKSVADKPWLSFTTHSEVYREKLVRLGVRAAQIEVIPNSFDPKFAQGRARHAFAYGDHLRVISVARMDIWKGHEYLIRGFARFLREGYSNASLTLVGYGPEELKLRELVLKLGIEEQVRFNGRAQHYEVPVLLRNHDVYVQPSIKHPETLQEEGQPIAVLEAIATGIPVIVTDTGGMAETVRVGNPEGSAFIIPDKSEAAIASALLSVVKSQRDESARAAYVAAIVQKHAREGQLRRTLAVYARALSERGKPSPATVQRVNESARENGNERVREQS